MKDVRDIDLGAARNDSPAREASITADVVRNHISYSSAALTLEDLHSLHRKPPEKEAVPPLTQDTTALIMSEICQHEPGAWDWWKSYLEVVLTWDHIMDGDPVDSAMADRAFLALLTQWPFNPFFNKSKLVLVPVMVNAISAWRYSDTPGAPKVKAYDCFTEMATTMAFVIGGQAMVDRYIPEIRNATWEAKDGGGK